MTTYAVTPTLFVGVDPPDGVSPVFNLSDMIDARDIVRHACNLLLQPWDPGSPRPAVVVPNPVVALSVLRGIGMSEKDAEERITFAVRAWN